MDKTIKAPNQQYLYYLDSVYPQQEFDKEMAHLDVVNGYQRELEQKLGRPVDYLDAEWVAYSFYGIKDTTVNGYRAGMEARIEVIRKKYASP